VIGLSAHRLFGTRYLALAYGYEFMKFRPRSLAASLLRAVYRRAAAVIAISRFTRDKLVAFGMEASSIDICLPGANTPPLPSASAIESIKRKLNLNGHRLVLSVGRMVPRKGHVTLVRAMPQVLERHPGTVLVCAGRGPCHDEALKLGEQLRIQDNLRLPGHLDDAEVDALYSMCDVFALPAGEGRGGQAEGFGLVFAEAAARGKPVVAGNSGGIPDAVRDGETGVLVPPENPEATAAAIDRLLSDRALADRMGAAGRARVESELNWSAFTRAMLAALERRS
jgi:phosphatidylinositol alpha-1,6-mannosyltransferase